MGSFDITPIIAFAVAAIVGFICLLVTVIAGIWIDLPSWAFLAGPGVPAIVAGTAFHLWAR
ncbi:hypothetical protein [Devosia sp.]|uniref:hypothetical protein n=1 Tax=Devosia sp. TaxID=1871048 RepID=UPI001AC55346|nr:hypothetical protein [Devosia sp.]MBN9333867.1 hypothetical protein [Devosia sp.]